ncbi:MAG: ABC transporter ATP-binding protein [Betaproteobacteria bacterium]|jgi:branched-chain amino acid transport system ATP-binding protein|nr:ABC transporter ATP-binding protein [Betaproteobacteria bacterium]
MTQPLLRAQHISRQFGGLLAVDDVSFDVYPGEVLTLIGPNGAGKSTVFNVISRIYPQTAGQLEYRGKDLGAVAPHQIAWRGIARTFQNIELFEHATVLSNLLIGYHIRSRTNLLSDLLFLPSTHRQEIAAREHVEKIIDFLGLQKVRDSMVAGLPYGVRKVVELGRALCMQPELLLLDEPSSGLNPEETDELVYWIRDIVTEMGATVMMVEHDMSLVLRVSSRVVAMNQGRVIAVGTPQEVQSHPEVISAYLGSEATV